MSDSTIRPMTFDEIDIVSGGISYDQAYQGSLEGGPFQGSLEGGPFQGSLEGGPFQGSLEGGPFQGSL
ncbi:hypothetical protein ACJ7V3_17740 [Halomonas elongata]|uniref:hypothetical protein n=1 Tax=Halomonas elongata TaxID=2746 RepID=UPI0038D4BD55